MDHWHESYNGAPSDGSSWESARESSRVLRGGSWGIVAGSCRSAARDRLTPVTRLSFGFRVVVGARTP